MLYIICFLYLSPSENELAKTPEEGVLLKFLMEMFHFLDFNDILL